MATKWYTLSVRVGVDEPINLPRLGVDRMGDPASVIGAAVREVLAVKGSLLVDDVYMFPEDA